MRTHKMIRRLAGAAAAVLLGLGLVSNGEARSNGYIPISDLGTGTYLGFEGGLYPGGSNEMPAEHALEGLERAGAIQPLDPSGTPDPDGKIVLLSIGMSNVKQEFCGPSVAGANCNDWSFVGQALNDPEVDRDALVMVNGAQGGKTAGYWTAAGSSVYQVIQSDLLVPQGLSEAQVQAVWVKNANNFSTTSLPSRRGDAYQLLRSYGATLRALQARYPNLQQVFFSSRIYAGYATTAVNPEPYAYESGFAVKWLIEAQIEQMAGGPIDPIAGDLNYDTVVPWVSWGPYLWADGLNPRSDGLTWAPADFEADGTHPSASGEARVGGLLLEFFKTSPHTTSWFLGSQADPGYPVAVALAAPSEGAAPLRVKFDGSSSSDDGTIVSYFWDFGDGGTSRAVRPRYQFDHPGSYIVSLTVTDDEGLTDTDTVTIEVVQR